MTNFKDSEKYYSKATKHVISIVHNSVYASVPRQITSYVNTQILIRGRRFETAVTESDQDVKC